MMIPVRETFGNDCLLYKKGFSNGKPFSISMLGVSVNWLYFRINVMARLLIILPLFLLTMLFATCQRDDDGEQPGFDSKPTVVPVQPAIGEVSGIADSKRNAGYLWAHEDGGNKPELYLINHNGTVLKTIHINGVTNRDWEDIAVAGNNILIGNIGDNNGTYTDYTFYKFAEPLLTVDTVYSIETIRFQYPDGPKDAEAFLVDQTTGAIYIITKRESPSRIYKLTPPFSSSQVAQLVGQLTYGGVVSATISPDGKEIITKTYAELGHYKISPGEKIETALAKSPTIIPYVPEPQGEAVGFSVKNNGYFTLSEKGQSSDVKLYFYKRK